MEEGDVRFLAEVYALVTKMQSIVVGVEGMKVSNKERENAGHAMAYDEKCFIDASIELEEISKELGKM